MSVNPSRHLAPCATTGIGGAPTREHAFAFDVPCLPELVAQGETMQHVARNQVSSWPWFLSECRARGVKVAKVQVPGPQSGGADATHLALGYARGLAEAGIAALMFIDEPMLVHGGAHRLAPMIATLKAAGAMVGVHCCGETDWAALVGIEPDVISFDAQLSLRAVLTATARWTGWLAIGAAPTDALPVKLDWDLVRPEQRARGLLTPACGLGLHSLGDSERVVATLREEQRRRRDDWATHAAG